MDTQTTNITTTTTTTTTTTITETNYLLVSWHIVSVDFL